jgi:hypothetical protein
MQSTAVVSLVERIHKSSMRCSIITTGAGGSAIGALMGVAGCSRTLLDAQVPYHASMSRMLLDQFPRAIVSEKVGLALAQAAFHRGVKILEEEGAANLDNIIGLGATAAIATDRSRNGADVAYISCWARRGVTSYRLLLDKDHDRVAQEQLVSNVMLVALADGAQIAIGDLDIHLPPMFDFSDKPIAATASEAATNAAYGACMNRIFTPCTVEPFESLVSGAVDCVVVNRHGCPRLKLAPHMPDDVDPDAANYLLYPGSFNPLHWGHTELARVASAVVKQRRDKPVMLTYEVAVSRVGKKDLSADDLRAQAKQFELGGHRIAFTTAKLFVEKARMFPHHGLIVGIDTVVRVLDPQFYGNDREVMMAAMRTVREHNCYFVVGGRLRAGEWVDLASVDIPEEIRDMFVPIPQSLFRVDISSTEIRERRASTV